MVHIYARTNEDLDSIVRGLNVSPRDYIIAVGGSGDQAFALLENARRVLTVDIEYEQVNHIKQQATSLIRGDYYNFLMRKLGDFSPIFLFPKADIQELIKNEMSQGTKYFNQERLDRIRRKIFALEVREADILDVCQTERGFNKVYLSNVLEGHPDELEGKLKLVAQNLPIEGLIYASNGQTIVNALNGCGLMFDEVLTAKTRDENWHPIILRKTHANKGSMI